MKRLTMSSFHSLHSQTAVEFWVVAGQHSAAFQAARVHGAVPVFVACLRGQADPEEGYNFALQYYEERALWEPAADLHVLLGNSQAAVQLYLKVHRNCKRLVPVWSLYAAHPEVYFYTHRMQCP